MQIDKILRNHHIGIRINEITKEIIEKKNHNNTFFLS